MKPFNKVVIIGLGLIGSSVGILLKSKKLAKEVVGVSRKDLTIATSKKKKAIDWGTKNLETALLGADLIILATPVETIANFASKLSQLITDSTLVTDVGSTKEMIVKAFESNGINFIGAHPLAGSEKRGPQFAEAALFKNSLCVVTRTKNSCPEALSKIKQLWAALGARVEILDPKTHDQILASVSHLPHLIAFSLVDCEKASFLKFAPSSFRDGTRVAASDPELWLEIFLSNKDALLKSLNNFNLSLNKLGQLIKNSNRAGIIKFLKSASLRRKKL